MIKKVGGQTKAVKKVQWSTRLPPDIVKFLKGLDNAAGWLEKAIREKRKKDFKEISYFAYKPLK